MKNLLIIPVMLVLFLACSSSDNATNPEPNPLELYISANNISADGESDGNVNLLVKGGTAPYTFAWSTGATTEDLADVPVGTYAVNVTDATNQSGTISIELFVDGQEQTVTDIEGNVYPVVKIGSQLWMAENLRVAHDAEGNEINSYAYNNDEANVPVYGRLYTWEAAMDGSEQEKARGIAPNGWHIPNDADWQQLFDQLGGVSVAGGKMKATGTTYWNPPNTNATNSSGFTSLPAGGGYPVDFEGMGDGTHYWSSTSAGSNVTVPTIHSGADVLLPQVPKTSSMSVRCIKN